ncbi:hypothetical protein BI347_14435 [Chromobacterium sphagni]|uniref:DUF5610 domain-containing protein n=1 Tax=Chromobacterium sphagni TaxID=1903179 RepID=A0A1S1X528_9NEIS|nr:DUF5610 domain-containing protein [Chromobacterium sphagni]OHX14569.1 hypothetical protein BI347_14435 [Chromobacterium sphagni]
MSISSLNTSQTGQSSSANQTSGYSPQDARNQLNSVLVESLSVSISSGKQSQTLLFQASITNINQILNADAAKQNGQQNSGSLQISSTQVSISVQQSGQSDDDNSPQATSKRILDGATSLFALYKQQHPELSSDQQAQNFVGLIRQGFEQGYQEATGVLKSLNVFNGDVASGIQQTHDLVEQGLDAFLQQNQSASTQSSQSAASDSAGG